MFLVSFRNTSLLRATPPCGNVHIALIVFGGFVGSRASPAHRRGIEPCTFNNVELIPTAVLMILIIESRTEFFNFNRTSENPNLSNDHFYNRPHRMSIVVHPHKTLKYVRYNPEVLNREARTMPHNLARSLTDLSANCLVKMT